MPPKKTFPCAQCASPATQKDLGDGLYYCNGCFEKWEAVQQPAVSKKGPRNQPAPAAAPVPAQPFVKPGKGFAPAAIPPKSAPAAPANVNAPRTAPAKKQPAQKDNALVAPAAVAAPQHCVVCHRVARDAQVDRTSVFCGRCFEATVDLRAGRRPARAPQTETEERFKKLEDQVARLQQQVSQPPRPNTSQNVRPQAPPVTQPNPNAGRRRGQGANATTLPEVRW